MTTEPVVLGGADDWAPRACTLPTAERPFRAAEFDELFRGGLRGFDRLGLTKVQMRLAAGTESTARALTARETQCCSFFIFEYSTSGDDLLLDVTVPAAHVDVLDALAVRAANVAGLAR